MSKPSPLLNQGPSSRWTAYMIIALGVMILITIIPMLLLPCVLAPAWAEMSTSDIALFVGVIVFFSGLGLFFLLLGCFLLRKATLLARREAKRERIMQRSAIDLLTQPPMTAQPMSALPLTIQLRGRLWFKIFASLLMFLSVGVVILEILGGAPFLMIMGGIAEGLPILILDLMAFGSTRLIVNDEGMTQKTPLGITFKTKWLDIRSVALAGPRTHALPIEFEIADDHTSFVVSWRRLPLKSLAQRLFYVPSLPMEAYNHQVDAVLAYVLDRTGLPLHDIRDD